MASSVAIPSCCCVARYADDGSTSVEVEVFPSQAKGDKDPAEWTSPAASAVCQRNRDWLVVKTRWGLNTDPAELAAINRIMEGCPDEVITVTLAR